MLAPRRRGLFSNRLCVQADLNELLTRIGRRIALETEGQRMQVDCWLVYADASSRGRWIGSLCELLTIKRGPKHALF